MGRAACADAEDRRAVLRKIARLAQVPAAYRDYSITPVDAERQFGLTSSALEDLAAAGLPHQVDAGTKHFDVADLTYLGIHLGTARAHLAKYALLAKSLRRFAASQSARVTVRYVPHLSPGSGPVAGRIALPAGGHRETDLVHNEIAAEASIVLISETTFAPAKLVGALAELAAVDLYELPHELRGDVEFSRRTGLSDCFTAAQMVASCCEGAGYEARIAEGLLVAIPWSSAHYWGEAHVNGTWLPLDPLMIRGMRRFGSLDPNVWPVHRSLAPMLARYPSGTFPLVTRADGSRIDARLVTSVDST